MSIAPSMENIQFKVLVWVLCIDETLNNTALASLLEGIYVAPVSNIFNTHP